MTHQSVEALVVARDDARYQAMTEGNLQALEGILSDALSYCHSTGAVESKAQYMQALRSGRVKYIRMDRDIGRFHAWADCAVMQGSVQVTAEVDGKPFRTQAAFTSTWVRENGAWVLAAWAATALPK
jgi:hypothetical protein